MADTPAGTPLPGIAALPPTTTRQISSGQVLVDISSVVKELIDNALDARAKSIFVDITANTIDSIQVKDDGHGIPAEDRALVCRRHCTSKIRDFHDLKEVGGKWLGFRGEALSSMAELSGTMSVTTRVEGEPIAVKLKYGRDGELISTERDSHPVGTTVKATQFFELIPVRKQTALKNSAKCLAKIRRMMQAYALARPAVRFRLRVLKAKTNKGDFVYAPKASSNLEDAVLKVIGKDCALQCDWTALETDDFEIHAFLPKPTANPAKIAHQGAFISIDSRPISSTRGTMKNIVTAFKEKLRKSNRSLATVKDPFFCMNIICPPGSYDPNIEPAKDDVMFDDSDVVLSAVDKLLRSYYPEIVQEDLDDDVATSEQFPDHTAEDLPMRSQAPIYIHEDHPQETSEEPSTQARSEQPRWRSSMYGIDEDDMEFLQENQAPVLEEEEGSRAAAVSNPWTIARMNAPIKPSKVVANGQLLSPAKSHREGLLLPSSPAPFGTPSGKSLVEPLTPQTTSRANLLRSPLDTQLEESIQDLPRSSQQEHPERSDRSQLPVQHRHQDLGVASVQFNSTAHEPHNFIQATDTQMAATGRAPKPSRLLKDLDTPYPSPTAPGPRRNQRKQQPRSDGLFATNDDGPDDTWFGQPMRGSGPMQPPRSQKRRKQAESSLFPSIGTPMSHIPTAERMTEANLYSENNTDIRSFFGQNGQNRVGHDQPFKLTRPPPQANESRGQPSLVSGSRDRVSDRGEVPFPQNSRASSAEPHRLSENVRDQPLLHSNYGTGSQAHNTTDQFRAYAERERPSSQPLSSSSAAFALPYRSLDTRDGPQAHGGRKPGTPLQNTGELFQAHENAYAHSHMRRPLSAGSGRPSIVPQRSNDVRSALDLYRQGRPSNSAKDMAAVFKAYQDREIASPDRAASPMRRQEPRTAPAHETATKSRPQRRRTTDGAQRTKSSKLPLERVPHGYHVQNVVLPLRLSVTSIIYTSRKLDMRRNSLEWGLPVDDDAYDAFAVPVAETKIMSWVVRLDELLHERRERLSGVDTNSLLHEGIQRGLDARKGDGDGAVRVVEVVEVPGPRAGARKDDGAVRVVEVVNQGASASGAMVVEDAPPQPAPKVKDENSDFDMSQFVDFDMDTLDDEEGEAAPAKKEGGDDFGDDIEDDMLLDM